MKQCPCNVYVIVTTLFPLVLLSSTRALMGVGVGVGGSDQPIPLQIQLTVTFVTVFTEKWKIITEQIHHYEFILPRCFSSRLDHNVSESNVITLKET